MTISGILDQCDVQAMHFWHYLEGLDHIPQSTVEVSLKQANEAATTEHMCIKKGCSHDKDQRPEMENKWLDEL